MMIPPHMTVFRSYKDELRGIFLISFLSITLITPAFLKNRWSFADSLSQKYSKNLGLRTANTDQCYGIELWKITVFFLIQPRVIGLKVFRNRV